MSKKQKYEFVSVRFSAEEREWVLHAAALRGLSLAEYVRRAINASLRKEGVDAVLLSESDERAPEGGS